MDFCCTVSVSLLHWCCLPENTTMHSNFLKLLNRILLYVLWRRYVITSFLMMSQLRHHYVVMWWYMEYFFWFSLSNESSGWFMHKNYEMLSTFVKVMQKKNCGLFFQTVYIVARVLTSIQHLPTAVPVTMSCWVPAHVVNCSTFAVQVTLKSPKSSGKVYVLPVPETVTAPSPAVPVHV